MHLYICVEYEHIHTHTQTHCLKGVQLSFITKTLYALESILWFSFSFFAKTSFIVQICTFMFVIYH